MIEIIAGRSEQSVAQDGRPLLGSISALRDLALIVSAIHAIADAGIRSWVAHNIFGDKLAGDLGFRTTEHHPKHDYGQSNFSGCFSFDDK